MALMTINGKKYDTDEIIGNCKSCGGPVFNEPNRVLTIPLKPAEKELFDKRLWTIGFCPGCYTFYIYDTVSKKLMSM